MIRKMHAYIVLFPHFILSLHFVQRSVTLARLLKISRTETLTYMTFQVLTYALRIPTVLLLNVCVRLRTPLSEVPQKALL